MFARARAAYRYHPHIQVCFEIHKRGQEQNIRNATLVPLVLEEETRETFDQGPRNVRDNLVFSLSVRSNENFFRCLGDNEPSLQY